MTDATPFFQTIASSLPEEYNTILRELCRTPSQEHTLDVLIRFVAGIECPTDASKQTQLEWLGKQREARHALDVLTPSSKGKRSTDGDDSNTSETHPRKRQKMSTETNGMNVDSSSNDEPLFTLHSISVTSPVRKKVDITIRKGSIVFSNPSSHVAEATILTNSLKRIFVLPTRGKPKPHHTIVLLSSDTLEKVKKPLTQSGPSNQQIIFGIDAIAPAPLKWTAFNSSGQVVEVVKKGSPTLPSIREFLAHLSLPILEPSVAIFRSACSPVGSNADGIPGVEAYRGAKPGSLWFFDEGILWGESKPCEFWSLEDMSGKHAGLRLISATGRTCSVTILRKNPISADDGIEGEDDEDDEETEFGMVDGREQEGIRLWVKQRRHLFGKKQVAPSNSENASGTGRPLVADTAQQQAIESDEDDEDFESDSGDLSDGSASSDSSDDQRGSDAADSGEDSQVDDSGSEDGEEELKAEHHPLMRPGAMPRMSRAAIDTVVGIVEEDFMGTKDLARSEEDDELED